MAFSRSSMGGFGAMFGGGLGSMFGDWDNPADSASPWIDKGIDANKQSYDPWIQAGQSQIPGLQKQYQGLMDDPGGKLNQIGQGYHQSPGFQFALQQALQGANHSAAAGGMVGSPQSQQQNMGVATGLANQDYGNYMQNALGMYGNGLSGSQDMMHQGMGAQNNYMQNYMNMLMQRAQLGYEGQNAENQHNGGFGQMLGGLAGMGMMMGGKF